MKTLLTLIALLLLGAGIYTGNHLDWSWENRDRLNTPDWPRLPNLPDLPSLSGESSQPQEPTPRQRTHAQQMDFSVWTQLDGALHSRNAQPIFSTLSQKTPITWLAPEGKRVRPGDRLVEFEGLELQERLADLEKNHLLAQADYDGLRKADLPIELAELDAKLNKLQRQLADQTIILRENQMLHRRGLISDRELEKQTLLHRDLNREIAKIDEHRTLTQTFLHPTKLMRAQTSLQTLESQLKTARSQVSGTTITAPRPGTVVYHPLHIDGEFRTVREGDTVFRNQKFMILADMEDLVVRCEVPEGQLARMDTGNFVVVSPIAFPQIRIEGEVESIGTMAHSVAGRPAWQKYFTVTIRLDESHDRLRSGMSVRVQILSYHQSNALVIPRRALRFRDSLPVCHQPTTNGQHRVTNLRTGQSNSQWVEILGGLRPGDEILLP